MKKLIFVFLVLGIIFPVSLRAQNQIVKIANGTRDRLEIGGIVIKPHVIKEFSLPVVDDVVSFQASYYEDGSLESKGPVTLVRPVNKGQVTLKDFDPNNNVAKPVGLGNETKLVDKSTYTPPQTAYTEPSSSNWWSTVTVTPQNQLKGYSIFVPTDPFRGLALKSGQTSAKSATLRTGEIVFPVFLTIENDSTGNSGIKFSWALVNKIVTEGQTVFEFKPEDIMKANAGETIKKTIVSKLSFDFIISEGASRGEVIPSNSPTKLELYVGWNILPIQYKDTHGLPTQAILILLVNDLRKPLMARSKGSVDQISVDRDNIVITNFAR
ncbi:MAG TPA: hypothetical protein VFD16_01090 [Candidatus Saccharimonadales bacterium]|nr:hypothetical protein [Candidatus Saccharimonadales bacterium]